MVRAIKVGVPKELRTYNDSTKRWTIFPKGLDIARKVVADQAEELGWEFNDYSRYTQKEIDAQRQQHERDRIKDSITVRANNRWVK